MAEGQQTFELTEDELARAITAFSTFDVDRRGVRLCDLKQIFSSMGEDLKDEDMFNVSYLLRASLLPRAPRFFSRHPLFISPFPPQTFHSPR